MSCFSISVDPFTRSWDRASITTRKKIWNPPSALLRPRTISGLCLGVPSYSLSGLCLANPCWIRNLNRCSLYFANPQSPLLPPWFSTRRVAVSLSEVVAPPSPSPSLVALPSAMFNVHNAVRIPLDFLQGGKFRAAVDNYIRPPLTKGVPSLFSDLSSLYNHPGKADILE
ncbi:uncharacterized protein DS421_14g476110 [Arachis hypogaea]|nr:uncharacterized protein DS421_14g476110 [Arachis hypogaea]